MNTKSKPQSPGLSALADACPMAVTVESVTLYRCLREREQLKIQRLELVNALVDCVESLERLPDANNAYRQTCINQARAALASVQPEAKP